MVAIADFLKGLGITSVLQLMGIIILWLIVFVTLVPWERKRGFLILTGLAIGVLLFARG